MTTPRSFLEQYEHNKRLVMTGLELEDPGSIKAARQMIHIIAERSGPVELRAIMGAIYTVSDQQAQVEASRIWARDY